MKIDRVRYDKKFSIGPYLTDSVGIEAQVDPGETPELVLTTLSAIVDEWHKSLGSSMYANDMVDSGSTKIKQDEIDRELDSLRKALIETEYQQEALAMLEKSTFKFNVELKAIAKSKPNKK